MSNVFLLLSAFVIVSGLAEASESPVSTFWNSEKDWVWPIPSSPCTEWKRWYAQHRKKISTPNHVVTLLTALREENRCLVEPVDANWFLQIHPEFAHEFQNLSSISLSGEEKVLFHPLENVTTLIDGAVVTSALKISTNELSWVFFKDRETPFRFFGTSQEAVQKFLEWEQLRAKGEKSKPADWLWWGIGGGIFGILVGNLLPPIILL